MERVPAVGKGPAECPLPAGGGQAGDPGLARALSHEGRKGRQSEPQLRSPVPRQQRAK